MSYSSSLISIVNTTSEQYSSGSSLFHQPTNWSVKNNHYPIATTVIVADDRENESSIVVKRNSILDDATPFPDSISVILQDLEKLHSRSGHNHKTLSEAFDNYANITFEVSNTVIYIFIEARQTNNEE